MVNNWLACMCVCVLCKRRKRGEIKHTYARTYIEYYYYIYMVVRDAVYTNNVSSGETGISRLYDD